MKRFLFVLLIVLGFSFVLNAKVVTTAEATKAALTVMQARNPRFSGTVASITPVVNNGVTCYYAVNFSPRGWALISADDQASPLLGYNTTGSFSLTNMPDNAKHWLSLYTGEINNIIQENKGIRHRGWSTLSISSRAATDNIEPLIKVHWNQPAPFNKYCPQNSTSQTSLVGCVAVAMAQAMSVFQYPVRPVGSHSYVSDNCGVVYVNYDKQNAYNWADIMSGANNYDEVARLLYHCGVATDMDYGVGGSGAYTEDAANALKKYFSYPASVTYVTRASYSGDWKQLLVNELKAGRPIIFGAVNEKGKSGHEFDLDGYDGSSMFHVNWGWGGALEGYFSIDALGNKETDVWTKDQDAIIGISSSDIGPYNMSLDNLFVKENQPSETKVGTLSVKSTTANPTYTYTVAATNPSTQQNIPFEVKNGILYTTTSLTKASAATWNITVTAIESPTNLSYSKDFIIYVADASDMESPTKWVTLTYERTGRVLTISSTKTLSYTLTTSDNDSGSGTVAKDSPVSYKLANLTAKTLTVKFSSIFTSKEITIILNK